MNFPPLRKLLWKIHFMLVYSSKTLDRTVTKQETWPRECEKSPDTVKPVGVLESRGPPTLGLPVILDCDLLPVEGELSLFLSQVSGKITAHASHSLTHTLRNISGRVRACNYQISLKASTWIPSRIRVCLYQLPYFY